MMLDIPKTYTKHTIQAHSRNIEEIMIVDGPRIWEDERMKLKIELPHLKVLYMSACVDKTNSDSEI